MRAADLWALRQPRIGGLEQDGVRAVLIVEWPVEKV
jgi:hypothetical protein